MKHREEFTNFLDSYLRDKINNKDNNPDYEILSKLYEENKFSFNNLKSIVERLDSKSVDILLSLFNSFSNDLEHKIKYFFEKEIQIIVERPILNGEKEYRIRELFYNTSIVSGFYEKGELIFYSKEPLKLFEELLMKEKFFISNIIKNNSINFTDLAMYLSVTNSLVSHFEDGSLNIRLSDTDKELKKCLQLGFLHKKNMFEDIFKHINEKDTLDLLVDSNITNIQRDFQSKRTFEIRNLLENVKNGEKCYELKDCIKISRDSDFIKISMSSKNIASFSNGRNKIEDDMNNFILKPLSRIPQLNIILREHKLDKNLTVCDIDISFSLKYEKLLPILEECLYRKFKVFTMKYLDNEMSYNDFKISIEDLQTDFTTGMREIDLSEKFIEQRNQKNIGRPILHKRKV